ncbi:MAG: hypothetical protein COZ11_14200 [Deltaproteobacteria bacterium CG_4_10_14_3_um_filter_51_14]|nr:MAG: hypothetical protein COZ11_14200 [Deltaproteobacteria bacterium CG_4_10_14_3_um_filter_51_14]
MRIEYHSKSDDKSRCHFTLFWMAGYHPGHPDGEFGLRERGQVFLVIPKKGDFHGPKRKICKKHNYTNPRPANASGRRRLGAFLFYAHTWPKPSLAVVRLGQRIGKKDIFSAAFWQFPLQLKYFLC